MVWPRPQHALCCAAPSNWGREKLSVLQLLEELLEHHLTSEALPHLHQAKMLLDQKIVELEASKMSWPSLPFDGLPVLSLMLTLHATQKDLWDFDQPPLSTLSLLNIALTCKRFRQEVRENVRFANTDDFSEAVGLCSPRMLGSTFPHLVKIAFFDPLTPRGFKHLLEASEGLAQLQVLIVNVGKSESEYAIESTRGALWRCQRTAETGCGRLLHETFRELDEYEQELDHQIELASDAIGQSRIRAAYLSFGHVCSQGGFPALKYLEVGDNCSDVGNYSFADSLSHGEQRQVLQGLHATAALWVVIERLLSYQTAADIRHATKLIGLIAERGAELEWRNCDREYLSRHDRRYGLTALETLCLDGAGCWQWDAEEGAWKPSYWVSSDDWSEPGEAWGLWKDAIAKLLVAGASTAGFAGVAERQAANGKMPFYFSQGDCAALLANEESRRRPKRARRR
jgi:hypothetical protein